MSRIHYTKPSITALEIEYANDAVTHGWGERCYEYVAQFEELFKHHLGGRHAIAKSLRIRRFPYTPALSYAVLE